MMHVNVSKYTNVLVTRWSHETYVTTQVNDGDDNNDDYDDINK